MRIISGTHRNRALESPKGIATRPTSERLRETVFNICQHKIEGAKFLDLFAGSGAIGLEALSRGASSCTFVEKDFFALKALRHNIQTFDYQDQTKIFSGDVFSMIAKLAEKGLVYDLVYADPPYDTLSKGWNSECYGVRIVKLFDELPLLAEDGILFVEEGHDFIDQLGELSTLSCKDIRKNGRAFLAQFKRK
jgi:16S rRNA (guanine966-N2)-methyltransferase